MCPIYPEEVMIDAMLKAMHIVQDEQDKDKPITGWDHFRSRLGTISLR